MNMIASSPPLTLPLSYLSPPSLPSPPPSALSPSPPPPAPHLHHHHHHRHHHDHPVTLGNFSRCFIGHALDLAPLEIVLHQAEHRAQQKSKSLRMPRFYNTGILKVRKTSYFQADIFSFQHEQESTELLKSVIPV